MGSHNMIDAMLYQSTGSHRASFQPPGQELFEWTKNKRTRKKNGVWHLGLAMKVEYNEYHEGFIDVAKNDMYWVRRKV